MGAALPHFHDIQAPIRMTIDEMDLPSMSHSESDPEYSAEEPSSASSSSEAENEVRDETLIFSYVSDVLHPSGKTEKETPCLSCCWCGLYWYKDACVPASSPVQASLYPCLHWCLVLYSWQYLQWAQGPWAKELQWVGPLWLFFWSTSFLLPSSSPLGPIGFFFPLTLPTLTGTRAGSTSLGCFCWYLL